MAVEKLRLIYLRRFAYRLQNRPVGSRKEHAGVDGRPCRVRNPFLRDLQSEVNCIYTRPVHSAIAAAISSSF